MSGRLAWSGSVFGGRNVGSFGICSAEKRARAVCSTNTSGEARGKPAADRRDGDDCACAEIVCFKGPWIVHTPRMPARLRPQILCPRVWSMRERSRSHPWCTGPECGLVHGFGTRCTRGWGKRIGLVTARGSLRICQDLGRSGWARPPGEFIVGVPPAVYGSVFLLPPIPSFWRPLAGLPFLAAVGSDECSKLLSWIFYRTKPCWSQGHGRARKPKETPRHWRLWLRCLRCFSGRLCRHYQRISKEMFQHGQDLPSKPALEYGCHFISARVWLPFC